SCFTRTGEPRLHWSGDPRQLVECGILRSRTWPSDAPLQSYLPDTGHLWPSIDDADEGCLVFVGRWPPARDGPASEGQREVLSGLYISVGLPTVPWYSGTEGHIHNIDTICRY